MLLDCESIFSHIEKMRRCCDGGIPLPVWHEPCGDLPRAMAAGLGEGTDGHNHFRWIQQGRRFGSQRPLVFPRSGAILETYSPKKSRKLTWRCHRAGGTIFRPQAERMSGEGKARTAMVDWIMAHRDRKCGVTMVAALSLTRHAKQRSSIPSPS
jgi:hypothetical protein